MSVRIRFRTGDTTLAWNRALFLAGKSALIKGNDTIEPAKPGDTWRLRWSSPDYPHGDVGPLAGYAIGCEKCGGVRYWTTANNCASRRALPGGGFTCDHEGKSSCWDWTGSAEDGTLTAKPSLQDLGDCKWHGWLTNGELAPA